MKLARTVDAIVYWIIIPVGLVAASANLALGWNHVVTGLLALVWTGFVFMSHRQYRAWRDRTNQWARVEKEDRRRFAISVLELKSQVAMSSWDRYRKMAGQDEKILAGIVQLYQEVADSWLPDDAPDQYHELKRSAARVVETGRPERVLH